MSGNMDRRTFINIMGAAASGGIVGNLGLFERAAHAAARTDAKAAQRPNIVFIMVDEMRYPNLFPAGISTPDQFLASFMPNLHQVWRHGVKFESYYSGGSMCSPARAVLATGLYPHQQWLSATRITGGPALQPDFPTYGKLLRSLGYITPHFGKWHLSDPPEDGLAYLENYGFTGHTLPDPTGNNGEGVQRDFNVADEAAAWLNGRKGKDMPFAITVSLVNPHDIQFFWAGTEGDHFEALFAGSRLSPLINNYSSVPGVDAPPRFGYPTVPPNWESAAQLRKNKPSTQLAFRVGIEAAWGGVSDDPKSTDFAVQPAPFAPKILGTGVAPYSYWQRAMDVYTYLMTLVDEQIGKVVAAVPEDKLHNTVFVFVSDHGDYNGAHGFISGKAGSFYDEVSHVPLIVADPGGHFTHQTGRIRPQLVSSVDLTPFLVTLGNGGSRSWMKGSLRQVYAERLDLMRVLRNPDAPGRDHVLFASDETLPQGMNVLGAPEHVLGVRTAQTKLVTYTDWKQGTAQPDMESMQTEFYDYSTDRGRAELDSTPDDPRATALVQALFQQYVPGQMEATLPASLQPISDKARGEYLSFKHGALAP